jgi:protein-L-isoaspartate(D-aspartate) O-methyltransferase
MTDSIEQRINMVESQVRPSDITDRRIIRAMLEVPREAFVPDALKPLAYMDDAVPVVMGDGGGSRRCLLPPRTFAKLVQLAEIDAGDTVLDVGCATGYSTAILARLAKAVIAVESDAALAARATAALRNLGVANALVIEGPLPAGSPSHAPFAAIVLDGAAAEVPHGLLEQLKDGGRLVAIIGERFGQARVWLRSGKTFDSRPAFDAGAETLPGFARQAAFTF